MEIRSGRPTQRSLVITWFAREYEPRSKNTQWYWTVGAVGVAAAFGAVYLNNILFALIILFGSAIVLFYGRRAPDVVHYTISARGLQVGTQVYPFQNLRWFCIHDGDPALLILQSTGALFPRLSIPIVGVDPSVVHEFLSEFVKEEHHELLFSDHIAKLIGF